MGKMAQTFISEIEQLAVLKCRATGLSTSLHVPYGRKVFSKSVRQTSSRFTDVKFTTFAARNAVNDVKESACKIMLNNEIGQV